MFASICINTCDRPGFLWKMLVSLSRQTHRDFEVVVVDDGNDKCASDKRIKEATDELGKFARVVIHKNDRVMGLAASRNVAMDIAKSDIVIKLDDDHYCDSSCVEELCRAAESHADAGCIGMLFPRVVSNGFVMSDRHAPVFGDWKIDKEWVTQQEKLYSPSVPAVVPAKTIRGLMLYRKDPNIRHDERLSAVSHGEDTIFSMEYLRNGYSNYVCTRAVAWHLYAGSGGCRRWGNEEADRLRKKDAEVWKKYMEETKQK